ncbi:MAG: ABC transporter ATP-binding protein [Candidatus Omnitrophica bacterium]|nr:ABC transporter ATP-binding protein [Candidatus Omnitrophota bacterium]
MEKMLEIKKLEVSFRPAVGESVKILRGVNLSVGKNESLALAGESGSGKTVTARAVMKLLPNNMNFEKGEILIRDRNVMNLKEQEFRKIRGKDVSMIFQEPSSYLNPVFTAGSQVLEAVKGDGPGRKERTIKLLNEVGLKENVFYQYPHQLSGGMQQRVMIAMALINNPGLLIADEPTTALDVTTAYGIVELLKEMMEKHGLSMLFITHDISLAVNFANMIAVMYAGRIVELAGAGEILNSPLHPYTEMLVSCLPEKYKSGDKIKTIEGKVPDFRDLPKGCSFHPRCPYKKEICLREEPGEMKRGEGIVRCFKYGDFVEA